MTTKYVRELLKLVKIRVTLERLGKRRYQDTEQK